MVKLLFRQKIFAFFRSYDVYNETEETLFTVKGKFDLGCKLHIYGANGVEQGLIMSKILSFFPIYEIYRGNDQAGYTKIGEIRYKFSLFKTNFVVDFKGWQVEGDWLAWDFVVKDKDERTVAVISKEHFHFSDTYSVEVDDSQDLFDVVAVITVADLLHDGKHD